MRKTSTARNLKREWIQICVNSSQYCDPTRSPACRIRSENMRVVEDPCDHCIYYHGPQCLCPESGQDISGQPVTKELIPLIAFATTD